MGVCWLVLWASGLLAVASAAAVRGGEDRDVSQCISVNTCMDSLPEHDGKNNITSLPRRTCSCDTACALYGDCCRDAETYDPEEQARNKDNFACVALRTSGEAYMLGRCAPDWDDGDDGEVASLCALGDPSIYVSRRHDPLLDMPVTSFASRMTYTNVYCALCNREDPARLLRWALQLECPTLAVFANKVVNQTQDFLRRSFVYNEDKVSWGLEVDVKGVTPEFHTCYIDPVMPERVAPFMRPCVDAVSSCVPFYPDGDVIELCAAYSAVVYQRNKPYRNAHCAKCNYVEGALSCNAVDLRTVGKPMAFAVLLDFGNLREGNIVGSSCGRGQIWDPFFKRCRSAFCKNPHQEYVGGRCVTASDPRSRTESPARMTGTPDGSSPPSVAETTTEPSSTTSKITKRPRLLLPGEPTPSSSTTLGPQVTSSSTVVPRVETLHPSGPTTEHQTTVLASSASHLANCTRLHMFEDELERGKNGSIFLFKYNKTFERDQYEPYPYGGGGVLVCTSDLLPEAGKFSPAMAWITLACLGLSCLCLVLHLVSFALTPSPKNLSEKNLTSLCLALLVAYVTFLTGQWAALESTGCFVVAAVVYYFFLASFCWMNVLAFDTHRMLKATTKELRVSTGRQWRKFAAYSLYGWVLPGVALLVLVLIDVQRPDWIHRSYLPMMGEFHCWFGQRKALLLFFAAPLGLIMAANLLYFISAVRIIKASKRSRSHGTSSSLTSLPPEKELLIHFKLNVRLALMVGLTWIFGIFAGYLNLEPIWYIFVVLNSLQGLFIFTAFTKKERIFPKRLLDATKRICSQGFRSRVS